MPIQSFETIVLLQLERLYERYVLQANLNHLTSLLGLLIAASMVMEIGLVCIAVKASSIPDEWSNGKPSTCKQDQMLNMAAVIFGIIIYIGLALQYVPERNVTYSIPSNPIIIYALHIF